MARGAHKWMVIRKHPTAGLHFYQGLGYCVEVDGRQLSSYEWSPVNAWAQADLQPLAEPRKHEGEVKP